MLEKLGWESTRKSYYGCLSYAVQIASK